MRAVNPPSSSPHGTCPQADEAPLLEAFHGHPSQLATADEFQWRIMQLPRAEQRLTAFLLVTQIETQATQLQRQLEHVCTGCFQARVSGTLKQALAIVLAIGNAMNEGTNKVSREAW